MEYQQSGAQFPLSCTSRYWHTKIEKAAHRFLPQLREILHWKQWRMEVLPSEDHKIGPHGPIFLKLGMS